MRTLVPTPELGPTPPRRAPNRSYYRPPDDEEEEPSSSEFCDTAVSAHDGTVAGTGKTFVVDLLHCVATAVTGRAAALDEYSGEPWFHTQVGANGDVVGVDRRRWVPMQLQ